MSATARASRGQTAVEKIVERHVVGSAGTVRAGDFVSVKPHHVMTHDNTAAVMLKFAELGAEIDTLDVPVVAPETPPPAQDADAWHQRIHMTRKLPQTRLCSSFPIYEKMRESQNYIMPPETRLSLRFLILWGHLALLLHACAAKSSRGE